MKWDNLNFFWATQVEKQVAIMCSDQQKATWWVYKFIQDHASGPSGSDSAP